MATKLNLSNLEGGLKSIGAKPDIAYGIAEMQFLPALKEEFRRKYGRDPNDAEIEGLFSSIDFQNLFSNIASDRGNKAFEQFRRTRREPGKVDESARGDSVRSALYELGQEISSNPADIVANFRSFLTPTLDRINDLTLAKNAEINLAPNEVAQILSIADSGERQKVLNSFIKAGKERGVNEFLTALPGKQDASINALDRALMGSQTAFFNRNLQPSIEASLNRRGLLTSGSLAEALGGAAANLNAARESAIAPLRHGAGQEALNKSYENILRGALESGKSLSDSIAFVNSQIAQRNQNEFTATQRNLDRDFENEMFNKRTSLELEMAGGKSPSGLDYFLQYGLPTLTSIGGTVAGGYFGNRAAKIGADALSAYLARK